MKNTQTITCLILIIALFIFGCEGPGIKDNKNNPSANSVTVGEKYYVDTTETIVRWEGSMAIASEEEHAGYVHASKGELMIEKGQLVGGKVDIDMNTIEYGDKENKNTPIKHLKSPDYFDVNKFPTASFAITGVASSDVENIQVTGNLTIKGVTKAVSFPAKITVTEGIVNANGKLVIDRTDWGIRYNSGKFYDIVADQIVSDDVEFLMKIVAKKAIKEALE